MKRAAGWPQPQHRLSGFELTFFRTSEDNATMGTLHFPPDSKNRLDKLKKQDFPIHQIVKEILLDVATAPDEHRRLKDMLNDTDEKMVALANVILTQFKNQRLPALNCVRVACGPVPVKNEYLPPNATIVTVEYVSRKAEPPGAYDFSLHFPAATAGDVAAVVKIAYLLKGKYFEILVA